MTNPKTSKKILIAGNEIGGQMQLLADTLRRRWYDATSAAYNNDFRGYQNDVKLGGKGIRASVGRFMFFIWALIHYDVFHFFWGISLWSWWRFHLLDLPILKLFGKRIIVHFRGLDIVDIRYFDYLREKSRGETVQQPPMSRRDQIRRLRKWMRYADVVLVSEPDLFAIVPSATLSPQVIDTSYWTSGAQPLSEKDGIFRIAHAPSSRRKKGTDFIEEAVRQLIARGHRVELVLAENLPHHKIRELYDQCDIGIDQVLYGWHGKVSVELMAMGKPVVCFIDPALRKHRPDLPIVSASPADLVGILEELISDSAKRKTIGDASVAYSRSHHDVEKEVDHLLLLYGAVEKTLVKNKIENAQTW